MAKSIRAHEKFRSEIIVDDNDNSRLVEKVKVIVDHIEHWLFIRALINQKTS